MQRRAAVLAGCLLAGWTLVTVRLAVVTCLPDGWRGSGAWPGLRARAALEHLHGMTTDDGRGRVLYRSGQPWSGRWRPVLAWGRRLGVHSERTEGSTDPVLGQVGLPDVWPQPLLAVAEQGRSGLERSFDAVLRSRQPGVTGTLAPAPAHASVPPLYTLLPKPGADVRTTVDPAWQALASRLLRAYGVRQGAVVVLATASNEVLAMASCDAANPERNNAVRTFTPGSVFKLVTAGAAWDAGRAAADDTLVCRGVADLPGVRMRCWTVHGRETLLEALAQSCDAAFARVGWTLGRQGLETASARWRLTETGLQQVDGRVVLAEAETGKVFATPGADAGLFANTAIGQQDVRLSPLQVAGLVAALADGGVVRDAQLVRDAELHGRVLRDYRNLRPQRAVSAATAAHLLAGMRLAVVSPYGTAHKLADAAVPTAVKTGTAELANGHVNAWVTGVAPYPHAQVAFCVLVADAPSAQAHRAAMGMVRDLLAQFWQWQPAVAERGVWSRAQDE
ncbi:MAG: hypothetical protein K6T31_07240 [Alicyclobacillus sp.]|nr:hypothetical protein [Alicyclobacillus sp.]